MQRTCGVLLHPTSLPTEYGIGDLGPAALEFARFLAEAGQRHWQVLPLGPTSTLIGNSPYSSFSAFGGSILLISPRALFEKGFINQSELNAARLPATPRVDYEAVTRTKTALLRQIFDRHQDQLLEDEAFVAFMDENAMWLNDLAFFMAAKHNLGGAPWWRWPADLRDRHDLALAQTGQRLASEILFHKFGQFLFFSQLAELRRELAALDIGLIGDAPIYVTQDSPDVWCNRTLFKLDERGLPRKVAGVPPDYFSKDGQRWGNPVFDWRANAEQGFAWWISRLEHNFRLFKQVRLDHFRGFSACWEVDEKEKTAKNGHWVATPGAALLEATRTSYGSLPLIAEDLGIITPEVVALRKRFGLPGMRVLQFAFSENLPADPNAPHFHEPDSVVYTGTHDNNTTLGWFQEEADPDTRMRLGRYMGRTPSAGNVSWALIEMAAKSAAAQCVIPAQDLLALGADARMNTPGVGQGNWAWRLTQTQMDTLLSEAAPRLAELTAFFGREASEVVYDELPEPPEPW